MRDARFRARPQGVSRDRTRLVVGSANDQDHSVLEDANLLSRKTLEENRSSESLSIDAQLVSTPCAPEGIPLSILDDATRPGAPAIYNVEGVPNFIILSPAMRDLLSRVKTIAKSQVPVLITGETGTGKEMLARAVHASSARRDQKFIPFNCTTLVRETAESQLFGHKRGAFTGALNDHPGIIRAAEGGTLFLDEIGELSLELQPKLLRFLQTGEAHPVGATGPVETKVRVVAATNRNLAEEVRAGRFRQDLFYRLNVVPLHIPPLRERREEILPLIERYLEKYRLELGKSDIRLGPEAAELMAQYAWPGNVRELCHEAQRLALFAADGEVICADRLSPAILDRSSSGDPGATKLQVTINREVTRDEAVAELERQLITRALARHHGNLTRAARSLELTIKGLKDKMRRLGIERTPPDSRDR